MLTLVWSSRAPLCAQLLSFLDTLPVGAFDTRMRALRLLRLFGGAEQLPLVRRLLLDAGEPLPVRAWALEVGVSLGLRLEGAELRGLLEEGVLEPYPCLHLARSEADVAALVPWLGAVSAWVRTDWVLASRRQATPLPGAVLGWLYGQWCREDRPALEAEPGGPERNLQVAAATWTRPESWALLSTEARRLPADALPQEALHQLLREDPEALREAAEALRLPVPSLLLALGTEGLVRRLEQVVRAQGVALNVPYGLVPPPEGYERALALLGEWPEARALRLRLLCDFAVALEIRDALARQLLRHERPTALRWARAALAWPANASLVHTVLREAAASPQPEDRPLFLAALEGPDAVAGCFALEGLLLLEGDPGAAWTARLEALGYAAHPLLRVRAAAGLARRGEAAGWEALRHTAHTSDEPWLRAEALRWLGHWNAPGHVELLTRGLRDDSWEKRRWPEADEAAWALFRWGSPEALGALLTAHLHGGTADIEGYLEAHLSRQEGRPEPPLAPPRTRALVARFIERPDSGG
ncbi:HEAT repeat domain-containing protein [Archangium primigenium]|uniref:HEAT repeat domain-containing protein n=1 Tax=[Archangium] primigenium TaxID=2792470 RepID=UPI00195936C0|nr:HEAT repeat domain-containing protein [Archangium primigenium]MBM7116400.1 HEAT repeat domain-containing protein [Archangium primigenium]